MCKRTAVGPYKQYRMQAPPTTQRLPTEFRRYPHSRTMVVFREIARVTHGPSIGGIFREIASCR